MRLRLRYESLIPFMIQGWVLATLLISFCQAQLSPDLQLGAQHNASIQAPDHTWHKAEFAFNPNPITLIGNAALFVYQKELTYQVHSHCIYHPSCSEFTRSAIAEYGILKGTMLGLDRLTRCNGVDAQNLFRGPRKGNLPIDLPSRYKFK